MKVKEKKIENGHIRLEACATAKEVGGALNRAQIAFATQMGLQPEKGKTPAQVAKERLGISDLDSIVSQQAEASMIPFAIDKRNLVPAFPPQVQEATPFKRGLEYRFVLDVTPKPQFELTSYNPVEISVPRFIVNDEEIDRQIGELAKRFPEYEETDPHPLRSGDDCRMALKFFEGGVFMDDLSTEGQVYTVGEGLMPDGFDESIIGMNPGETRKFHFDGFDIDESGKETTTDIECTATLLSIQKEVLPVVDDAWVAKNLPLHKDLKSLREHINEEVTHQSREQYDAYVRAIATTELSKRFDGKIDDGAFTAMRESIVQNMRAAAVQQKMTFEQFVEMQGGEQEFNIMVMVQARETLVQGYALDALYRHEKMSLTKEDIEATCGIMNPNQNPKRTHEEMIQQGQGFVVREAAERLKASLWLVDHATISYREERDPSEA